VDGLFFTPQEAIERFEEFGDLFRQVVKKAQRLLVDYRVIFNQQRAQNVSQRRSS